MTTPYERKEEAMSPHDLFDDSPTLGVPAAHVAYSEKAPGTDDDQGMHG